jgi:DNA-binding transcriptional ArsR family regulator
MDSGELDAAQNEMRERQRYGPPVPPKAASGRGRKPVGLARTGEVRDKVTAWKLTAPEKRQPGTIRALAEELGVSKSTVEYHLSKAPDGLADLIEAAESDELRNRHPKVIKTLCDLAEAGNIEAIKVYLKELVGPRRPKPKAESSETDLKLQIAIQNLFGAPAEAAKAPDQVALRADSFEGQVVS